MQTVETNYFLFAEMYVSIRKLWKTENFGWHIVALFSV